MNHFVINRTVLKRWRNAVGIAALFILLAWGAIALFKVGSYKIIDTAIQKEALNTITGRFELDQTTRNRVLKVRGSSQADAEKVIRDGKYVTIAQLSKRLFIVANYIDILLFDREKAEICVLKPNLALEADKINTLDDLANVLKNSKQATYNPTGVYIDNAGDIYVANYKGNNILRGQVLPEKCQLKITGSYSSPKTGGPENVTVDRERDVLVSANYDSGTVTAFRLTSGEQLWSADVGQAHGVTIMDDKVYVTGLTERKVYEFALFDGKLLQSKGSLGWNPLEEQYIWPTSINPSGVNELVVSDAQSGFISYLNADTLEVIRYTGGNGPTYRWFNYPYAAVPIDDGIAVLSTNREQILFLNRAGDKVKESFYFKEDRWPKWSFTSEPFGKGWQDYQNVQGPKLQVYGQSYQLGFGHLHPDDSVGPILRVPDISTLFNFGPYIYFLQGGKYGTDFSYFFSSSSTTLAGIISQKDKPDILLNKHISLDSWLLEGRIASADGEIGNAADLAGEFKERATLVYKAIDELGYLSTQALYEIGSFSVLTRKISYEGFIGYLDKTFISSEGREFKLAYDSCSKNTCDLRNLKHAAKQYYLEAKGLSYVNLDEYMLVGMLAGVRPEEASLIENSVTYDDCGLGKYYDGFGAETLLTKSIEDYLSAHDINTSYICFSAADNQEKVLKNISLGWYSKIEVPKHWAIFGIKEKGGNKTEILLKDFNNKNATVAETGVDSIVTIKNSRKFNRYMIRVFEGGVQNRLILRHVHPSFVSNYDNSKPIDDKKIIYDNCDTGKYYDGYDLGALRTQTLDDYLSAQEITSSYVCFSKGNKRQKLKHILLGGWLSKDEAPKRLAIYGLVEKNKKQVETLLHEFDNSNLIKIGGHFYLSLDIRSKKQFNHFMVKGLEGGTHNPFILRALVPTFLSDPGNSLPLNDSLFELAGKISQLIPYGSGTQGLTSDATKNIDTIRQAILSAESAHCGNYVFLFASNLPSKSKWSVFDLKTYDGRIHSVVEVKEDSRFRTFDPTLGVVYNCSLQSLIDGSCDYASVKISRSLNPSLSNFFGAGFFYGADIIRTYSSINELIDIYRD